MDWWVKRRVKASGAQAWRIGKFKSVWLVLGGFRRIRVNFWGTRHSAADASAKEDGSWKIGDGKTDFANAQAIWASCDTIEG